VWILAPPRSLERFPLFVWCHGFDLVDHLLKFTRSAGMIEGFVRP
jgi:hypothetical protein